MNDYQVRFSRDLLFGLWHWSAITPDGRSISGFSMGHLEKQSAEKEAARFIRIDQERETISGKELAQRVDS